MAISIIRRLVTKLAHPHRPSACTGPLGHVPQELLDLIIGYLADDKATLLSCALVHPTWTSISRYRLPPLTLIASSASRCKELAILLRSSRETLSPCITGIVLVGDVPFNGSKSSRVQSYRKLLQILQAKHVTLHSVAVENDPSIVGLVAQYFPALTELKVTCASYQDITSFVRALAGQFPRLSGLSIELGSSGIYVPDASLSGLRDLALGMPVLRTLRVVGWNNDLVRWLGINVLGTLEKLELQSCSVWSTCHVEEAYTLLQRNQETLQDLKLNFVKHVTFDLSGLTRLQHLEMTDSMCNVLDGGLLPRSLESISIHNATCALAPYSCTDTVTGAALPEECILLERPALQRLWGI